MQDFIDGIIEFFEKYKETMIDSGHYVRILEGLRDTLIITLGALVIGVMLGALVAVVKYFAEEKRVLKPFAKICDIYVTVVRGIPMTVLLMIFFYIIFASSNNGLAVAIITFGINSGAYMAELIRSGINAVDRGQMEAGRSLGMSQLQTMRKVIFPQAIKNILPAIGNEMIALLKETSVAGYVMVVDLTRAGNLIKNVTYDAVSPILTVAVTYLVLVILLTFLLSKVEKRLNKSAKRRKSN